MTLPYLIKPNRMPSLLVDHARGHREETRKLVRTYGAVLFRGFELQGVEDFEETVRLLAGPPLSYHEKSSPRSRIQGGVYTSTEHPSREEIFFHNENSYQASWPMTLFFYCVQPPRDRGATPLADCREILRLLDSGVLTEFTRRRWMLVRNFGPGFGLPWQDVFETTSRDEATAYCAANGIEAEWLGGGTLRTRVVRDAVRTHPDTGESVWFNHAAMFHLSTLSPDVRVGLEALFASEELPNNTYFGDGGPIPDEVMAHVRDCYRQASTRFDYREGDVVMLDNMLTAHAREPFTPPRKVAVAMAESVAG
ncbi:TauD/TfdA family dioxygenase [Streptomyces sp. NPDC005303]|uniref:TauD/TfdA family dioxygenase n=1 Tax=Streptomyces sp. NPDC005303 TaxID=3155713 RepID=UPI00339FF341